jgi:hypothetical protein
MTFSEPCFECGINTAIVEGVCEECLEELRKTWNKMDDWLMGNV